MIVVAIIGVLVTLAAPRYTKFTAKAKQSEARTNLSYIYTLQMSAHSDNDQFVAFSNAVTDTACSETGIGFSVSPCNQNKVRYSYDSTGATSTFVATATAAANIIVPNCATADTWTIDEGKDLKPTSNAVKLCP